MDLHPWNTDFTWETPNGPFQVLTEEQAEAFDRDGFVVLENVFDSETLEPIIADLDQYEQEVDSFLQQMDNERLMIAESGAITFATHCVTRSETAKAFSKHPIFAGLCVDLVGPDANLYWDQAVYKKPAKPRRFPWHQDNGYTFVEPQQYLTCWVALTDATIENGCPQVARGRHIHGTLLHHYVEPLGWECLEDPDDVAIAEVGAGGIVVFSSLTPHLTGPNTTDAVRKSYILQYTPVGAEILAGDPSADGQPQRTPTDDSTRQFPVVRDGRPVPLG